MAFLTGERLREASQTAQAAYEKTHPQSRAAHVCAAAHLPGGNTRAVIHMSPFPLTFVSARGAELTTLDGHVYVDFLSEYTSGLLGHSHPRIIRKVQQTLEKGYNFGGPNQHERELARLICERFGPAVELVRFTNSGTEANMVAIAAAKAFTHRQNGKILVFSGAYHGSTIGFRDGTANNPMLLPHDWIVAPYDDIQETHSILQSVPKGQLAAILVEPILGSGGAVPCSAEFLKFLRTQASALGALLICDEVMASRLAYRGLSQDIGVRPDLMTFGKWIGGGMTFGAFGGRRDVMSLFDPSRTDGEGLTHAGTFNNNIVTMSAGCEALQIYDETEVRRLNGLGEQLKTRVNELFENSGLSEKREGPLRIWISGRGSMLAVRFAGDDADVVKALFWQHMLSQGIYIAPRGFISLNIAHIEQHVNVFESGVASFLQAYVAGECTPKPKL